MKIIYRIVYDGTAFGDNLFTAFITKTLNQNQLNAKLDNKKIEEYVECELFRTTDSHLNYTIKTFNCRRKNRTGFETKDNFTVYTDLIYEFKKQFGISRPIEINLEYVPVKYLPIDCASYDICIVSQTGWWTPYRNWPHFTQLKSILNKNGISYIDLSENNIRGIVALNYIQKCKIYLGLETGISHYVSKFANEKTIIIQSGYAPFKYWASHYKFDCIDSTVNCSPCWKRSGCPHHDCMVKISAEQVYEKIKTKLNDLQKK